MKIILPFVIYAALSLPAVAQEIEAQKHSNPRAEAAGQAEADARARVPLNRAVQPEAMRSFNARSAAVAEQRKAERLRSPKHPADRSRMMQDAAKL